MGVTRWKAEVLLPLPGTEPIPYNRYREGLFSVGLASGKQRTSCYRYRERASVTRYPKKLRSALVLVHGNCDTFSFVSCLCRPWPPTRRVMEWVDRFEAAFKGGDGL